MDNPIRAADLPVALDVEADRNYWWCSCGRSAKQPFCDGAHAGTPFTPVKFTATETRKVFLCTCKATANPPFCDGSHAR